LQAPANCARRRRGYCSPKVLLEVGVRDVIANDVYEYWAAKRRRWGKPILRRLQAPTSASDTNPFNVFRCARRRRRAMTAVGGQVAGPAHFRRLLWVHADLARAAAEQMPLPTRATFKPSRPLLALRPRLQAA
jgi:hypothetical protein